MKKSFRFYADDHMYLQTHAADYDTSMRKILKRVFEVHDSFSHFFEDKLGQFSLRQVAGAEIDKVTLAAKIKVYALVDEPAKWMEDFIYDEQAYMESKMHTAQMLHHLIAQYKYYLDHQGEVLKWYRLNMPEELNK